MTRVLQLGIAIIVVLAALAAAAALSTVSSENRVGFQISQSQDADGQRFPIALWYPTTARPWPTTLAGNMLMNVAKDGPVSGSRLPLIVISHGLGAGPTAHLDLAMALASAGYVVAAPMHPGDNFVDHSAVGSARFFNSRARQFDATVDHVLKDWRDHSLIDAQRVGAYGFSMGGFTVLSVVGAQPDLRLIAPHCARSTDVACSVLNNAHSPFLNAQAPLAGDAFPADARIKAAVLAAPGFGFTMSTHELDQVRVPLQLWIAEHDENANNAEPIRAALGNKAEVHFVKGAGHFSFLAPCGVVRVPGVCNDPAEFDRRAFHERMNTNVLAFFAKYLKAN